jgi:hypothetical protein
MYFAMYFAMQLACAGKKTDGGPPSLPTFPKTAIMPTMADRDVSLCKCMKKAGHPVAPLVHIADAGCRRLPDNQVWNQHEPA